MNYSRERGGNSVGEPFCAKKGENIEWNIERLGPSIINLYLILWKLAYLGSREFRLRIQPPTFVVNWNWCSIIRCQFFAPVVLEQVGSSRNNIQFSKIAKDLQRIKYILQYPKNPKVWSNMSRGGPLARSSGTLKEGTTPDFWTSILSQNTKKWREESWERRFSKKCLTMPKTLNQCQKMDWIGA